MITFTDLSLLLAFLPKAVGRDIDATTLESYSFAAPEVSPNAAIYFLQFTSSNDPGDTLWTTRFTVRRPTILDLNLHLC